MTTEMLNTVKNFLESLLSKEACLFFLFTDIVCLVLIIGSVKSRVTFDAERR